MSEGIQIALILGGMFGFMAIFIFVMSKYRRKDNELPVLSFFSSANKKISVRILFLIAGLAFAYFQIGYKYSTEKSKNEAIAPAIDKLNQLCKNESTETLKDCIKKNMFPEQDKSIVKSI
jgi:hypothetical protein